MALGTFTKLTSAGEAASIPLMADLLSFSPDTSYPVGGYSGFAARVQAKTLDQRAPIAVIPQDCSGYYVTYDRANDKLKVYYSNSDSADGPMVEVPDTTDIHTATFVVLVLSQ